MRDEGFELCEELFFEPLQVVLCEDVHWHSLMSFVGAKQKVG